MRKLKLNVDLTRVKKFLFEKGERVALGVCGALAVLLLFIGLRGAMGSGRPEKGSFKSWEEGFAQYTTVLEGKINHPAAADADAKGLEEGTFRWPFILPGDVQNSFFELAEQIDIKRRRPPVLRPRDGVARVQYIQGAYFRLSTDNAAIPAKTVEVFQEGAIGVGPGVKPPIGVPPIIGMPPGGPPPGGMPPGGMPAGGPDGAGGIKLARELKPVKMALISAVFPMQAQFKAFANALRLTESELLSRPDLQPRPTGLIVRRFEKKADGTWNEEGVILYDVDDTGKTTINTKFPKTEELFRLGMFYKHEPKMYEKHVAGGLMTPLPLLANQDVPLLMDLPYAGLLADEKLIKKEDVDRRIQEVKEWAVFVNAEAAGGGVKAGGEKPLGFLDKKKPEEDTPSSTTFVPIDKVAAAIPFFNKERLTEGNPYLNPFPSREELLGLFDPRGGFGVPDPKKGPMPVFPDPGKGGPGTGLDPSGKPLAPPPSEALIRFLDADLEQGKTYGYMLQVRLANPNFGDKNKGEVAFAELTKDRELVDKKFWWPVPLEVSLPGEFDFYVVDVDKLSRPEIPGGSDDPKTKPAKGEFLAMQIHRLVSNIAGERGTYEVGDWAIAERLLIRKGEFIERQEVRVEVPLWDKFMNNFSLKTLHGGGAKKEKKAKGDVSGLLVNFVNPVSTKKKYSLVDFEGGKQVVPGAVETVNVSALILAPDGRLMVRNSMQDARNPVRKDRVSGWTRRISVGP